MNMNDNNTPVNNPIPPPTPPETVLAGALVQTAPCAPPITVKQRREYSKAEYLLIIAALLLGILFDRLMMNMVGEDMVFWAGIFWLCYLILFYIFNWQAVKNNRPVWIIAAFAVLLCCWGFIFDYRSPYGTFVYFAIPCVLMAHAQLARGGIALKEAGAFFIRWLGGWFLGPFSAIGHLFGALISLIKPGSSNFKKTFIGIAFSLPLLLIILPLLMQADSMFGYYVENILLNIDMWIFFHIFVAFAFAILFFSFLWNSRFGQIDDIKPKTDQILDTVICCSILGVTLLIYLVFCSVQFTYLFARAGLPNDMTYSEYAVEGFWQLVAVAAINLFIFGLALRFAKPHFMLKIMLYSLLGLTGFMLVSSFVRLSIYIDAYGFTWLRLLSTWFIIFLAAVLILCAVRMIKEKLPLIAICAFLLIGWFTVLGYANPDALIIRYNLTRVENPSAWAEENITYINTLSDNAIIELYNSGVELKPHNKIPEYRTNGMSLSSHLLRIRS